MLKRIVLIMIIPSGILTAGFASDPDRGVLVGSAPRTDAGGQRWALIIGINDYTNVPALRYGRSDAETLSKTLVEKCGFPKDNVVLMTDGQEILSDPDSRPRYPTRGNLRSRINQIAQLAGTNDLLMISFAGHGINIDGKGYLMPVDGDSRDIGSLVPLSWIKETLESSQAKQKLLMLDACHSGARAGDDTQSPADVLLSLLGGAGFVTLASCDSRQLSHEDTSVGRGVFTNAIIEGLEGKADSEADGNHDGVITATELFGFASLKVKQWSLTSGKVQTPVLKGEFTGRIELARFKSAEELKIQKEELQKRLEQIQGKETDSVTEQLQKEITELEAQLNAISGGSSIGDGASDDFQAAKARFNSTKKQVEDIKALLEETLKTYQPTSTTVAKIRERLEAAKADFIEAEEDKRQADEILYRSLDNQIQAKQEAYKELIKEVLPTSPQAISIQDTIRGLEEQLEQYVYATWKTRTNSIGMKFVWIPSGDFIMGSPFSEKDRDSDEGPKHKVKISKGFWIGMFEVTQSQYQDITGDNPSNFKGYDLPVEEVSWRDAVEFCNKLSEREGLRPAYIIKQEEIVVRKASKGLFGLGAQTEKREMITKVEMQTENSGYRLPTEAEWEYACRAGTQTRFYFGDNDSLLDEYAWYSDNSGNITHPVGQKKPNAFGLYDMHGNVWEWCQDWYGQNYYSSSPSVDPHGPSSGESRVLRGGAWNYVAWSCRSAGRLSYPLSYRGYLYGFRVILEAE